MPFCSDPERRRQRSIAGRRDGAPSRSGPQGQVGIAGGSSPLARRDAPNLFESHRALTETGAVRVRWDREQLIGGKPERLVSRVLRVLIWGSGPENHRN